MMQPDLVTLALNTAAVLTQLSSPAETNSDRKGAMLQQHEQMVPSVFGPTFSR